MTARTAVSREMRCPTETKTGLMASSDVRRACRRGQPARRKKGIMAGQTKAQTAPHTVPEDPTSGKEVPRLSRRWREALTPSTESPSTTKKVFPTPIVGRLATTCGVVSGPKAGRRGSGRPSVTRVQIHEGEVCRCRRQIKSARRGLLSNWANCGEGDLGSKFWPF